MCEKSGGMMNPICVSVGELQMKRPFIQSMQKKLDGTIITDREALMLALDTPRAEKFAVTVLIEVVGSCNQWTTCRDNKAWFQEKIDEARRLQAEIIRFETI
jgi:hypothetical protein